MSEVIVDDFKQYIRIIGRGQRSGRTLTLQEAQQAMSLLINGQVSAEQKGAFLMLLRMREETPEELAGFVRAFRKVNTPGLGCLNSDLDLGCYAGKRRHLPWFLLSVLALAQTGKRIFLHGSREPGSQRLYLDEVLNSTGFRSAQNIEEARQDMEVNGFCYMDLKQLNPSLDHIIQLRSEFGLRSCANTLARMLNPSGARESLQGVFHRHVDERHRHTATLLASNNVLCFRGEGGEIEFNPERDVALHRYADGLSSVIHVPASLAKPVIKPRQLEPVDLIRFWNNKKQDVYGTHAVLGTLAVMLMQLESDSWSNCMSLAKQIWNDRDPDWPVFKSLVNIPVYPSLKPTNTSTH